MISINKLRECCGYAAICDYGDCTIETCNHINNTDGYCDYENCPILNGLKRSKLNALYV